MRTRRSRRARPLPPWQILFNVLVLGLAIAAFFFPLGGGSGDSSLILALDDDTVQPVAGSDVWTSITYNRNSYVSSAWSHTAGGDAIACLRTGIYQAYFSVQLDVAGLTANASSIPWVCRPCQLRHKLRATRQLGGAGLLTEVRPSHTRGDREATFLSKSVLFYAARGDVMRFQFSSLCEHAVLTPGDGPALFNTYPSSASLYIVAIS
jgi:hypothetical protein